MESATFSLLKASQVDDQELERCRFPRKREETELLRVAFSAANCERKALTILHATAIGELVRRFVLGEIRAHMWEAAEAFRALDNIGDFRIGETVGKTKYWRENEGSLSLMAVEKVIENAGMSSGCTPEKRSMAIRVLASHCANGHLSDEEERMFRSIVLWNLRKETNEVILKGVLDSLETAPSRETKGEAARIVRNRDVRFSAQDLRKLRKYSEGTLFENEMVGRSAKISRLSPSMHAQGGPRLGLVAGGRRA
jgi:hypothetical protein